MIEKNSKLLWIFIVLVIAYMAITIGVPPNPESLEKYNITATHARILNISFVLPLAATWMVAYYGYYCFRRYAERVRDSREGPAFRLIERGAMVLVYSLPVQGIISAVTNYIFINNPDLQPTLTILRNYLYMVLFTTAFILISRGCSSLLLTLKNVPYKPQPGFLTFTIVLLSGSFVSLLVNKTLGSADSTYFLPTWLIVVTLGIPYLYAWSRGIQGLYDLRVYLSLVKGNVYRLALKAVVVGLGAVMALNIFIQLLVTASTKLNRLDLTPLLLIIYLLVFCYVIGFGLLARGSRKLTQIEEA